MADFDELNIAPDYGAQQQSQPTIKLVRFGDGYEQRQTYGLNQNPKIWNLEFVNRPKTDADAIQNFLDDRAEDQESFEFTPPGESVKYKFVCEQWTVSIPYNNIASISATFRQVFEP